MESPSLPLRLLVDKERNKVVMAMASRDFIDTLFSFLTLPLGTIVRLQSSEIGCINNLYNSVQNSSTQVFWNEICKNMLLCPRNPCEKLCNKLRFNVDDTGPIKYFKCSNDLCGGNLVSTFAGSTCSSCGRQMLKEMKLKVEEDYHGKGDGVFVRGHFMYLIFDDFRVLQDSPGNIVKQLTQLGYKDFTNLTEISSSVGSKQIMDLLKRALISKSPLSDVFLAVENNGGSDSMSCFKLKTEISMYYSLKLKITLSKSMNKIMYAEADEDFSDFVLSFLTMPLGSVLKLLEGDVTLGSMQNLYQSVKGISSIIDSRLLDLKVASQHRCVRRPLEVGEEERPYYFTDSHSLYVTKTYTPIPSGYRWLELLDPRSGDGTMKGFLRRPSGFVVMDDLKVLPLMTTTSSISVLQKLDIPLDDFEEHEVEIGSIEALNLLGASLTSNTTALTNGLSYLVKKPKIEERA